MEYTNEKINEPLLAMNNEDHEHISTDEERTPNKKASNNDLFFGTRATSGPKNEFIELHQAEDNDSEFNNKHQMIKATYSDSMGQSMADIAKHAVKENLIILFTAISNNLIHLINLIILNFSEDALLMHVSAYQIGIIYLSIIGFHFIKGSLDTFRMTSVRAFINNRNDKIIDFYNESKIFSLLFLLIIIFPLGFIPNYILPFLYFEADFISLTTSIIKLLMVAYFLDVLSEINCIFLNFFSFQFKILALNLTVLVLHCILSTLLVFYFNKGVIGIGISLICSSLAKLIITQALCLTVQRDEDPSLLLIHTEVLERTSFYYYTHQAFVSGVVCVFKYAPFDVITLFCFYINQESFLATIITFNIISFFFQLIKTVTVNFENMPTQFIYSTLEKLTKNPNELENFLIDYPELNSVFKSKSETHDKTSIEKVLRLQKIISSSKYTKTKEKLDGLYIDYNLSKINALIKAMLYFGFTIAACTAIILAIFNTYIVALLTNSEWITGKVEELLYYYSVIIFADWGFQIYLTLIHVFSSTLMFSMIRGLFAIFVFLPLGFLFSSVLGWGVNGFWFSIYIYFVMFFVSVYIIFDGLDLKKRVKYLRKKMELKEKSDEIENYYKE